MDFSSPFFPIGAVLGNALKGFGSIFGGMSTELSVASKAVISTEASVVEQAASAPVGRLGSPMNVSKYANNPAIIDGRTFTGHALDQMQGRGLVPSVVNDVIANGSKEAGKYVGTFVHELNGVRAITNQSGDVITTLWEERIKQKII